MRSSGSRFDRSSAARNQPFAEECARLDEGVGHRCGVLPDIMASKGMRRRQRVERVPGARVRLASMLVVEFSVNLQCKAAA
jgi:hypothetical protein